MLLFWYVLKTREYHKKTKEKNNQPIPVSPLKMAKKKTIQLKNQLTETEKKAKQNNRKGILSISSYKADGRRRKRVEMKIG